MSPKKMKPAAMAAAPHAEGPPEKKADALPFSYKIAAATLHGPATFRLIADAAARQRIAAAFGIVSVDGLKADFELAPRADGAIEVKGVIEASVQQHCVATFEPVPEAFREPVDVTFATQKLITRLIKRAEEAGIEDFEPPDLLQEGEIDLGALACEFLALGLNPYPRKAGAQFEVYAEDADPLSPFAALQALPRA